MWSTPGKVATGDLGGGLVSYTPTGAMVFVRRTRGNDLSGLNAVVQLLATPRSTKAKL